MRSKLSAITARTPRSAVPFAAQSREEPDPYSLPARITKAVPADWYGRSGPMAAYGVLQNMKIWNGALNPKQVKEAASIAMPAKITLAEPGDSCEA